MAFLETLYVLFFIEIGTRRVHVTVSTTNPDSAFVTQQARNLVMSLADEGTQVGFLIRDRDAKFPRSFDDVFVSEGIRVIRTPIRAPNANAFAERWVETLRAECLDPLLIGGPRHLDRILAILCAALQPATPASRPRAWGTRESCADRRGRRCARHRTARSPRWARPRVHEGRMIEF
jgi:hypothetical protein